MTSRRKARRRWLRWCRYWDHYMGERFIVSAGGLRAYDALVRADYARLNRQLERDGANWRAGWGRSPAAGDRAPSRPQ